MAEQQGMVFDRRLGKVRPILPEEPELSSASAGWRGFYLEEYTVPFCELDDVFRLNTAFIVLLDNPLKFEWKENGRYHTKCIQPGEVSVCPANIPYTARCRQAARFVSIGFAPSFLACVECESFQRDHIEMIFRRGVSDPFAQALAMALHAELTTHAPSGRLYSESLATALAVHVLSRYSSDRPRIREHGKGLSRQKLRQAIEFINEYVTENFSLKDVANAVGLSPYHFSRMFKQSAGQPPHRYHLKCRVERARELLLRGELTPSEIASEVGFSDQSHFTFHFKRAYGMTPKLFLQSLRK